MREVGRHGVEERVHESEHGVLETHEVGIRQSHQMRVGGGHGVHLLAHAHDWVSVAVDVIRGVVQAVEPELREHLRHAHRSEAMGELVLHGIELVIGRVEVPGGLELVRVVDYVIPCKDGQQSSIENGRRRRI
ncbi:MAG: hypothetical protein GY950_13450, partial [bacterium]|nr:hypothetical protein [bacterium]